MTCRRQLRAGTRSLNHSLRWAVPVVTVGAIASIISGVIDRDRQSSGCGWVVEQIQADACHLGRDAERSMGGISPAGSKGDAHTMPLTVLPCGGAIHRLRPASPPGAARGTGGYSRTGAAIREGNRRMKVATNTNVSLDGVMQGLGGADEDRRGGFERGGWAMPHLDEETAVLTGQVYQRADAFMFGRWTYETFARSWGTMADSDDPIAVALNTRPKYVASTTLSDRSGRIRQSYPQMSRMPSAISRRSRGPSCRWSEVSA